jgi:hypothetical protein
MAKALGPLAHGYAQLGADGTHGTNQRQYFETVPADGYAGCQCEETKTSVRRRFLGSSSGESVFARVS